MATHRDEASHICVFGVGGVGGYFGGKLAWELAERGDVEWKTHFIARGPHLAEIRKHGLILDTPGGRLVCRPSSAVERLSEAPVPDVVLVCVKGYDLDEAARRIAGHCREDTVIIPLLNGVDIHARIRAHVSSEFVLPACAFVGTHIERPGVVAQQGGDGVVFMGSDPDHPDFVPEPLLTLFERAGIPCRWFDDPRPALWEKYLFISAFGLVTAASRRPLGEVLADAALMEDARGIMNEVVLLAASEGVALGPDAVGDAVAKAGGFPPDARTSYQRDVEAGRRDESDLFGGTILRLGRRHGVPTPVAERVYAQVRSQFK